MTVAIDVARDNLDAAGHGENRDALRRRGAEPNFNPILSAGKLARAGLYRDLIGVIIAVEIVDGVANRGVCRDVRKLLTSGGGNAAAGQKGDQQKEKSA